MSSSPPFSQSPATGSVLLRVRGLTPMAFKNRKRAIVRKGMKFPMLITEPKVKKRMDQLTDAIECELRSAFLTGTGETLTAARLQSLIASCTPADDCWTQIPELVITSELVAKGEEGCDITIERL